MLRIESQCYIISWQSSVHIYRHLCTEYIYICFKYRNNHQHCLFLILPCLACFLEKILSNLLLCIKGISCTNAERKRGFWESFNSPVNHNEDMSERRELLGGEGWRCLSMPTVCHDFYNGLISRWDFQIWFHHVVNSKTDCNWWYNLKFTRATWIGQLRKKNLLETCGFRVLFLPLGSWD